MAGLHQRSFGSSEGDMGLVGGSEEAQWVVGRRECR